jgi:hypothetical protein
MFYLIHFDNIESEETKQLQFDLSGYPNGTILTYATHINMSILPTDKWIVWIDKNIIDKYNKQYINFSNIKGVKRFIELDVTNSIHDTDWVWNNDYINNIFAHCL